MELHKLGFKLFARNAEQVDLLKFIPVFHRWIQNRALSDLLLDVADYSHVPAGPGVMLIAHEGNYGFDESGHERGVLYYSKRKLSGELPERMTTVARRTLEAAKLMAQDPELEQTVEVAGNDLLFFANDRLAAPNTDDSYAVLEPALRSFLDRLYAGADYSLERESDPRERLSVRVRSEQAVDVDILLARLS